jgi:hypothetical protein
VIFPYRHPGRLFRVLPTFVPHTVFLDRIQPLARRRELRNNGKAAFHAYRQAEAMVRIANLDFLVPILVPLYSVAGRPARDPIPVLRSLLVMCHLGVSSITQWVYRLEREPILAQLCGLDPRRLPGVGTFYNLFHRLTQSGPSRPVVLRSLQRPKGAKKGKKAPPRRSGTVGRILRRLRRHPPKPPFTVLQSILRHVVGQSAQRGLLGPDLRPAVAIDGSPLVSGADGHGHRICGCKKEDPCTHPLRRYADPGARIGWDSHRNRFFYGRHLSAVVAAHGGHDLPIYLRLFQGGRHDSVAGAVAFIEAEQLYPEGFSRFVGDSAFDAAPIYVYLDERGTDAVIDLNEREVDSQAQAQKTERRRFPRADRKPRERRGRGKRPLAEREGITLDSTGHARCREGHALIKRGSSHAGHYTQWRCPLSTNPDLTCTRPCFYESHAASLPKDPRLQTRIPRGTAAWEAAMDTRTAAERLFSHLKCALGLGNGRHRSDSVWAVHTLIAALAMHIQAWAGVLDADFDRPAAAEAA